MTKAHPFKWRHFQADIIRQCVRWDLSYPLSYRQLPKMIQERGLNVAHPTI